jgi:hypothetical protein
MGASRTRKHAEQVVAAMTERGFRPEVIVNVGVGSCPEGSVWRRHYHGIRWIGIDPRKQNRTPPTGNGLFIQAGASDRSGEASYCRSCRSTVCTQHAGQDRVRLVRLDDVLVNEPGRLFFWMDIEGGEELALLGAAESLQRTAFVNVEMYPWIEGCCERVERLLIAAGFVEILKSEATWDRLYGRIV